MANGTNTERTKVNPHGSGFEPYSEFSNKRYETAPQN